LDNSASLDETGHLGSADLVFKLHNAPLIVRLLPLGFGIFGVFGQIPLFLGFFNDQCDLQARFFFPRLQFFFQFFPAFGSALFCHKNFSLNNNNDKTNDNRK